jgi:predicted MFS family arabinose efflux permease
MRTSQPAGEITAWQLARAIGATRLIFLLSGLAMAGWAPMVPYAKARLGLDEATLGLVLLALGGGSMVSMPLVGFLTHRFGSRRVIGVGGVLLCAALPLLALAPSLAALVVALLYFGVMLGVVDVAMNAHAVAVEVRAARPLMSGFHGLFSIGGLLGAACISALLAVGVSLLMASLTLAALLLLIVLSQWGRLLDDRQPSNAVVHAPRRGMRMPGTVWLLGALCFVSFLAEGSMLDWSAVFLRDVRGVAAASAGIGYAAFSLSMALARITGDAVIARFGPQRTVRVGALVAATGFVLAAWAPWPVTTLLGFVLVGLGAANIVPLMFGAAGRLPGVPAGVAIATVTAVGYAGLLAGPALIGFLAHASSLSIALALVGGLLVLVALTARIVRR